MISQTAVWLFDQIHCRPLRRSHTSIGGPTIPLKAPKTNLGRRWSWSGTPPHNTRMHRYAGLTSGQKADWKALADTLNNGHSISSPAPYSGPIAYMVVNLYRRLQGQPYSDDAPTSPPPSSALTGILAIANTTPREFIAQLTH